MRYDRYVAAPETYTRPDQMAKLSGSSNIDLVLCGNNGPDHTNPETLVTIDLSVPIAAGRGSISVIKGLKHFEHVYDLALWTGDDGIIGETTVPLPEGLELYELAPPSGKTAFLEVAFYLKWRNPSASGLTAQQGKSGAGAEHHALVHVPHGLLPDYAMPTASASLDILALVAGTQYSALMASYLTLIRTNHGTDAGFAAIARSGAKQYVATHDEPHALLGLFSWLQYRLAEKDFEPARSDVVKAIEGRMGPEVEGVEGMEEELRRVSEAVCVRPAVGETILV